MKFLRCGDPLCVMSKRSKFDRNLEKVKILKIKKLHKNLKKMQFKKGNRKGGDKVNETKISK